MKIRSIKIVQQTEKLKQKNLQAKRRKYFRVFKMSVGVFYFLILTGLMTRYLLLSLENKSMKNSYNLLQTELSVVNKTLLDEINQLKNKTEGKSCPEGWMRFRNRCYYKSTEKKTWFDSRIFCQDNGADLVTINSKEEQEFVSEMNQNDESWIGVVSQWSEKSTTKWKWVDGSPVLQQFWEKEFPKAQFNYYCAVALNAEGKWTQQYPIQDIYWICEK
ncbi:hypothetical protein OJAV_G00113620 [Oryzias javanicus]|uniref:C-type lectin domain-containing protein n=1 Tax=Oryzias javanicus TaxID=123683 RepID=A0A437CWP0_ORYJA|nr:hypothetical protein OJAV_G00113620 [Oryzias javanicus]